MAGFEVTTEDQYAHVLSTFSHKNYPEAPEVCLAKFDELANIGFEAFIKKYDPYWDIPLNESPPKPVIDLLDVDHRVDDDCGFSLSAPSAAPKTGRKR